MSRWIGFVAVAAALAALSISLLVTPAEVDAPTPPKALTEEALRDVVARARQRFLSREGEFWARGDHFAVRATEAGAVALVAPEGGADALLELHTRALRRQGWSATPVASAEVNHDGSLGFARDFVREVWHVRAGHAEQTWRFDAAPPGAGPLIVEVALRGAVAPQLTSDALHFPAGVGHRAVRYGSLEWVDADGQRAPLALAWAEGVARITVPAELLARSRYPAVLDPTVTVEQPVDAPLVGPAYETQKAAESAASAEQVMVVWEDRRHLFNEQIYGELFSRFGSPSDAEANLAIRVNRGTSPAAPDVAFNGQQFLVVWQEEGDGGGIDVYGAFVTLARTVSAPFLITNHASDQQDPAVAGDPNSGNFAVAFVDNRDGTDRVYATRVDGVTGASLDGTGVRMSSTLGSAFRPSATFDGTNFVFAWEDNRGAQTQVYAGRLSASAGTRLDGDGDALDPTSTAQANVSIGAGSNGRALAVWEETRDGGFLSDNANLFGRFYTGGAVQTPTPLTVSASSGAQQDPDVQFDGTKFWVAYQSTPAAGVPRIVTVRVQLDAGVSGTFTLPTDGGEQSRPSIAGFGNTMSVVFDDATFGTFGDVNQVRLDDFNGSISVNDLFRDEVEIVSKGAHTQALPAAAWDGTQYYVAWSDSRNFGQDLDIYGIRVAPDGTPKDPEAQFLGGGPRAQLYPHVVAGQGQFLVTWSDERPADSSNYDLVGVRVAADGGVLDVPPLMIADAGRNGVLDQVAEWTGSEFFLVFESGSSRLSAARLSAQGEVLTPPSGLPLLFPDGGTDPALAIGDQGAMLAFARGSLFSPGHVFVARLALDGGILDPDGLGVSRGAAVIRLTPEVTFDGTRFLASWTEEQSAGQLDLMGSWVEPTGARGTPFNVSGSPLLVEYTATAEFDGENVVFVWDEAAMDGGLTLRAGWLPPGGTSLSTTATVTGNYTWPFLEAASVGASNRGQTLIPYGRAVLQPGVNAERVFVQVADSRSALGTQCTNGSECRSGFCVDGVCCENACGGGVDDCQQCGGNGLCTLSASGTVCREGLGVCDPAEQCNGTDGVCPADARAPSTTVCRAAVAPCDQEERCDGAGVDCPADALAPATTVCRPAEGGCDLPEVCDGFQLSCPQDVIASAGTLCRAAASSCDVAEQCTGGSKSCGEDAFATDGTACDANGVCEEGVCREPRSYYGWGCEGCSGTGGGAPLAVAALLLLALRRGRAAKRALPLLGALLLVSAGEATAAEEEVTRLLVVGITPRAGVTEQQADTVASFVQSELTTFNAYRVSGRQEIAAIVGLERQKQLLGCSNEEDAQSCMAEVAGAMDADRVLSGDLGKLGEELLLNLVLVDARTTKTIHRLTVRARGSLEALLDSVRPGLYELVMRDTARKGPSAVSFDRGFGGIVASVRGEADVTRGAATPAVSLELSNRSFGGAVTVLVQPIVGVRAEGRFYPVQLGSVRPYVGVGATAFVPAVGARVSAGAAFRMAQLQLSADLAYEHFLNPAPGFFGNAAVFGLGAGWQF